MTDWPLSKEVLAAQRYGAVYRDIEDVQPYPPITMHQQHIDGGHIDYHTSVSYTDDWAHQNWSAHDDHTDYHADVAHEDEHCDAYHSAGHYNHTDDSHGNVAHSNEPVAVGT